MTFVEYVELVGKGVDASGIAIIVIGVVASSIRFLTRIRSDFGAAYRSYRVGLGRSILLGLEILIAGDIIRTVATSPTFRSVGVLSAIVLIRTFLSLALSLEVEGRLPWQAAKQGRDSPAP
ncbi:MAG: DUF1622 domain-containing protein [Actinomycetota bacterium]